MPKLVINTGAGLKADETGLHVLVDPASGNRLTVEEDGLCVLPTGQSSEVKLFESQYGYGIQVDWSPWGVFQDEFMDETVANTYKDKVSCNSVIHRTWTAAGLDPSTQMPYGLTGKNESEEFSSTSDWVFVGDFFRVKQSNGKYNYYLITQVSANDGKPGNKVIGYITLLTDGADF